MLGIKDQRTAGDLSIKVVDTTIPYFVIVWPEAEGRRLHPISNDPMEAKALLRQMIDEGLFIDGEESTEWINIGKCDWAFISRIEP